MSFILDILFPKKCIGCRKLDTYICSDCVSNILQGDLICPICFEMSNGGQTHLDCQEEFDLDGLWSLGLYRGFLKTAIKRFKYEPGLVREFAPVLVMVMAEYFTKFKPVFLELIKKHPKSWLVTPVPLHWWKENSRGFNQSSLIGQILSKRLGLSYCDCLKRIRDTKPQAKLKSYDRHQNIKNAFVVSSNILISQYPNILLIDDVWTTGSTLKECCYVLKKAGAKKVWALTLAR